MRPDAGMLFTWNCQRPHAFIRFVGNSLHPTDYTRVDEWVERIIQWYKAGLQSVWFFMHQHDERYSPELADHVVAQVESEPWIKPASPYIFGQGPAAVR